MIRTHHTAWSGGLLAAVLCVAFSASPAAAQDCEPPGKATSPTLPICNLIPKVTVTPSSLSTTQPSVPVTITAFDHYSGENFASFMIKLDGVNVTSQWGVTTTESGEGTTGAARTFHGRGNVVLSVNDPVDTLVVTLCDLDQCTDRTTVYTLLQAGVRVEQDGQAFSYVPSATQQAAFRVVNTGTAAATFRLTTECRNLATGAAVSPCSLPSPDTVRVPARDSVAVSATYNASGAGTTVRVMLRARQKDATGVQDAGWIDAFIGATVGSATMPPQVRLVPLNAGTNVERNRCVSLPAGPRAAYECGNVRIAHALPAVTYRSQTWAPTLVYNSQDAHPRPIVYADVTVPAGALRPTSLEMIVTLQNGVQHSASFSGAGFTAGLTRRMGVQWDGLSMETGLYPYTVQVVSHYLTEPQASAPVTGELVVVNRSASPFGAGWWMTGVERITCVQSCEGSMRILWIGGDGSTRIYEPAAGVAGVWVAQNTYGRPDTLAARTGGGFQRRLADGGRAEYTQDGLHTRSVTRLGDTTNISYGGWIWIAWIGAPGGAGWTLQYDSNAGMLRSVTASAPGVPARTTQFDYDATRRITGIVDPDSQRVNLLYSDSSRLVARHDDRQGARYYYYYNSQYKLKTSRVQLGAGASPLVDITTQYVPVESQGVALVGQTAVPTPHVSQAYTRVDGPRTDVKDVTLFWHADNGAVRLARDPLGAETYVEFDSSYSSLPVRITSPTGMVTRLHYDLRGRPDTVRAVDVTGDGRDHVVTHSYDDRWDAPVETRGYEVSGTTWTLLSGSVSHAAYDTVTGNPLWTQLGDDPGRRVTYRYYGSGVAAGLLASVRRVSGVAGVQARDSVIYDTRGNVAKTINPLGYLALSIRDALGRDSVSYTPTTAAGATTEATLLTTGMRREVIYDVMDRAQRVETIGPALTHVGANDPIPAQTGVDTLLVTFAYDGEGRTLNVSRFAKPDAAGVGMLSTTYTYDAAGRVLTETSGTSTTQTVREFEYTLAGTVMERTPRGHQIWSEHDALGRLTRRIVPEVTYSAQCPSGTNPCENPYPLYPNGLSGGLTIPEEWTVFRYDEAGNLVLAENGDAVVKRNYDRRGLLLNDSVYIRSVEGNDFTQHRYGVGYGWDLTHRTSLLHPLNLAGSASTALEEFAYDPATGAMSSMTDRLGHSFAFNRNLAGQLTSLQGPGFVDSTTYDVGGRPQRRTEWIGGGVVLNDDQYVFDARGKLMQVTVNGASQFNQWYSGMGMLVGTDWQNWLNPGRDREAYRMDALGNMEWRRPGDGGDPALDVVFYHLYTGGHARVSQIVSVNEGIPSTSFYPDTTTRRYDGSGNVEWSIHKETGDLGWGMTGVIRERRGRSYYDATERLRYFQERDVTGGQNPSLGGVWEEYRYDALGRRVLVNTRTKELCPDTFDYRCASATTLTVWSDDQVLWEIRGPSGSPSEVVGPPAAYGTVSYTYGGGMGRPLVITRDGVSVIPHQNWRGQFSSGTYPSGASSDCTGSTTTGCELIDWPGWRTTAWHVEAVEPEIDSWWGGHVNGMRGANGLMYMRNRSYDPATGQFTQPDPIGLAGGLSLYAYAGGDPVNNHDPTGLVCENLKPGTAEHNFCLEWSIMVVAHTTKDRLQSQHLREELLFRETGMRYYTDVAQMRRECLNMPLGDMMHEAATHTGVCRNWFVPAAQAHARARAQRQARVAQCVEEVTPYSSIEHSPARAASEVIRLREAERSVSRALEPGAGVFRVGKGLLGAFGAGWFAGKYLGRPAMCWSVPEFYGY